MSTQSVAFQEVNKRLLELKLSTPSIATFAGGCFWCMEAPFEELNGVIEAISGYAGGTEPNPTYQEVSSGKTHYREAVQIFFDPTKIDFSALLNTYWRFIDPTDDSGQFSDRGKSYTSAIFYHTLEQLHEAKHQIEVLTTEKRYDKPIKTLVLPFTTFYPAEDYHQDFYRKRAEQYRKYHEGSGRKGRIQH